MKVGKTRKVGPRKSKYCALLQARVLGYDGCPLVAIDSPGSLGCHSFIVGFFFVFAYEYVLSIVNSFFKVVRDLVNTYNVSLLMHPASSYPHAVGM